MINRFDISPNRKRSITKTVFAGALALALSGAPFLVTAAHANTSVTYNFNTTGSLSAEFNSYVQSGTISQSANGGIDNTGAINAPAQANAVFATKSSYSIGPIGSSYTFTAFLQSVGNSGYSGVGFTASAPSASTTGGGPFRTNDALGVSVHGGGFELHNGTAANISGGWSNDNGGVTSVKKSTIPDLLNNGSPSKWYKIIFKLVRSDTDKFNTRIEVWSANADGTLIRPDEADAIFEQTGVTNSTLTTAPSIYSYINFSGDRVRYFDNYQVSLGGGATVIAAGTPVVLTDSTTELDGVVSFQGTSNSDGGSSITERGFAYGTSTSPTISDNKVASGSGTGTFTGTTSALPNGTYYFRAYATNATGTSYGNENTVVITNSTAVATPESTTGGTSGGGVQATTATQEASGETLARTGVNDDPRSVFSMVLIVLGFITLYSSRVKLMQLIYAESPWLRYGPDYKLKQMLWEKYLPFK